MGNVPDGRDGLVGWLEFDTSPADVRFFHEVLPYRVAFCDLFATYAPGLWDELVGLVSGMLLATEGVKDLRVVAMARKQLDLDANDWADRYGLAAPWFIAEVGETIRVMIATRKLGLPEPTTVLSLHHLYVNRVPDQPGAIVVGANRFGEPTTRGSIDMRITWPDMTWDPFSESSTDFRRRVVDDIREKISARMIEVKAESTTGRPINAHWVPWSIMAHTSDWTLSKLSEEFRTANYKADRKTIREAVWAVDGILGFRKVVFDKR
jgi:hypothetical protein